MKQWASRLLVGVLLSGETLSFAQSAPLNDDFENRIILTGSSVTFTGTLQNATIQPGEPVGMSGPPTPSWPYGYYAERQNASVWWSWTASISGPVTIEVLDFSTNTFKLGAIDAWTGTNWSSGFAFVAGICLDIGRHPFLTFSATAGTTYQLRAIGTNYGDFTLKIAETNVPIIVVQPLTRTVSTNGSVFFGVVAAGKPPSSPPFCYQWRFNGVDLPGETFPVLGLDNLTTNQSGNYSVMVSNAVGGTISDIAILNVTETVTPPQLMAIGNSSGQFDFRILGDLGRLYRIQSSTNLINWFEEKSFPKEFIYYDTSSVRARNGVVYSDQDVLSVPQSSKQKFYRTTTYTPTNAVCINNLAQIRFAKEIWSLETKNPGMSGGIWTVSYFGDIAGYLKNGGPACPFGGPQGTLQTSYEINSLGENPRCKVSFDHVLEEPEF